MIIAVRGSGHPDHIEGQKVSGSSMKTSGGGSDFANICITVFAFIILMVALWAGDLAARHQEPDGTSQAAPAPPATTLAHQQ
jgi:hypothetical protein